MAIALALCVIVVGLQFLWVWLDEEEIEGEHVKQVNYVFFFFKPAARIKIYPCLISSYPNLNWKRKWMMFHSFLTSVGDQNRCQPCGVFCLPASA